MFNRHLLIVALLAGAAAVPYLSSSEQGQKLWASLTGTGSHDEAAGAANQAGTGHQASTSAVVPPAAMPPEGSRRADRDIGAPPPPTQVEGNTPQTLEDVLRFDITPAWIIERWPRVSSGLSQLDWQGYRVVLVTGTSESDLAGSLTYYFNKKKQAEKIIFHGTSGDPARLVALLTKRYDLKQQKSNDPGLTLFQRRSFGKAVSELQIRPASVLRSDMPQVRYEIELALKRP